MHIIPFQADAHWVKILFTQQPPHGIKICNFIHLLWFCFQNICDNCTQPLFSFKEFDDRTLAADLHFQFRKRSLQFLYTIVHFCLATPRKSKKSLRMLGRVQSLFPLHRTRHKTAVRETFNSKVGCLTGDASNSA